MAIPKDKIRTIITLKEYIKSCLEFLGEKDKRTPSKEIEFIIEEYIKSLTSNNKELEKQLENYYFDVYKPKTIANELFINYKKAHLVNPNSFKYNKDCLRNFMNDVNFQKEFNFFNKEDKILFFLKQLFLKHNLPNSHYEDFVTLLNGYTKNIINKG